MSHPYDNSQLSMFQLCPHKYYLKYIRGIERMSEYDTAADLVFGKYYHKFMELHYKRKNPDPEAIWADYPMLVGEELKTKEHGIAMCHEYLSKYRNIDCDYEVIDTEVPIQFNVGPHAFLVKADTVIRFMDNIYGLEHKTTKSLWYNYFDRYFINSQVSAQTYAIKQKYGQCSGVIVNVGELKYLKRGSKDRPAGINFKFERELITRVPGEVVDWYSNAEVTIKDIEACKVSGQWRKADGSNACTTFSGCQFKQLCKASIGMDIDEQIEEAMYEKVENPYAYMYE